MKPGRHAGSSGAGSSIPESLNKSWCEFFTTIPRFQFRREGLNNPVYANHTPRMAVNQVEHAACSKQRCVYVEQISTDNRAAIQLLYVVANLHFSALSQVSRTDVSSKTDKEYEWTKWFLHLKRYLSTKKKKLFQAYGHIYMWNRTLPHKHSALQSNIPSRENSSKLGHNSQDLWRYRPRDVF